MNAPAATAALPRGDYTGNPLCAPPRHGRRFYQCRICGGWVDSTDARQVAEHEGIALPAATATPVDAATPVETDAATPIEVAQAS